MSQHRNGGQNRKPSGGSAGRSGAPRSSSGGGGQQRRTPGSSSGGYGRPASGASRRDDRPQRSYDDRAPRRDDRGGSSRGYDDRAPRRDDRGDRGPSRSYGDRPQRSYDDRGPRRDDRGDRPQRSYDDRGPRRDDRGDRPQRSYGSGGRPQRSYDDRGPRRDDRGGPRRDRDARPVRPAGPSIPDSVTGKELDKDIRGDLRTLSLEAAEIVSRHLVMTERLLEDDPTLAWEHAKAAVARGGRLAVVREAAGIAAYAAGEYADALAQFRAARRISGSDSYWPIMADCERGLGRPERAITMAGAPEVDRLDREGRVEMRIVASGARRDLGQADAAVVTLQCAELQSSSTESWSARIKFAYAEALTAAGREDEAHEWYRRASDVDPDGVTEAAERLAELEGLVWVDTLDEDEDDLDDGDELDDELDDDELADDLDDEAPVAALEAEVDELEERVELLEDRLEELTEELEEALDAASDADVDSDVDPEDEVAELLGEADGDVDGTSAQDDRA